MLILRDAKRGGMKKIFGLYGILIAFIGSLEASADIYTFPPLYKGETEPCTRFNNIEDTLTPIKDVQSEGYNFISKAIDLNNDGVCELFVSATRASAGNTGGWDDLYMTDGTEYKKIADYLPYFWLGSERNGYARLFVGENAGHKTNPIYVVNVLYFDGEKYVIEHGSNASYGYYTDNGLSAYKEKDYETAEKWYLNAYRMNREALLKDANNLALTLIKLGKCQEATDLLRKHLNDPLPEDRRFTNSANFNLKLCEEKN